MDYPHIISSGTTSSQYNLAAQGLTLGNQFVGNNALVQSQSTSKQGNSLSTLQLMSQLGHKNAEKELNDHLEANKQAVSLDSLISRFSRDQDQRAVINQTVKELQMTRRIVQVYIADTDENVPLDKSLIYSGEQKLTDATDQELFHEIEIARILKEHNEYRTKLINKKVKERTEFLEPARIRDLKMVVVNVAQF